MVRKVVINDPMVEVSFNDQRDSRKPLQPAQLSISRKNDITGSGFYILFLQLTPLTITVLSTALTWCIVRCYLYSGRAIQTLDRLLRCFKSIIQADKRLPTGDLISLSGSISNSLLSCPSISFQLGNFDQLTSSDGIFNLIISPWSWWNEESGTSKRCFLF